MIPANESLVLIDINTINAPVTPSSDRSVTISIDADAAYNLSSDFSSSTFAVKDLEPIDAFLGAEGAGAKVTGGRGGAVIRVTNLNATGPGSFAAALEGHPTLINDLPSRAAPRTIVFDVSGTIQADYYSWGDIKNVTIAGQTAPEGGITVECNGWAFWRSENIIMRYIRVVNTSAFRSPPIARAAMASNGTNGLTSTRSGCGK